MNHTIPFFIVASVFVVLVSDLRTQSQETHKPLNRQDNQSQETTEQTSAKLAQVLPAQQAFELLQELAEHKLLIAMLGGRRVPLPLNPESSFGLLLPSGLRLLGESSGKDYGLSLGQGFGVMIGSLYSEADFLIYPIYELPLEGTSFEKGPYLLFTNPQQLIVLGTGSQYSGKDIRFYLFSKIDESLFSSSKRPRFSIEQEAEDIFILVEGNKLKIKLK